MLDRIVTTALGIAVIGVFLLSSAGAWYPPWPTDNSDPTVTAGR